MSDDKKPGGISRAASQIKAVFRRKSGEAASGSEAAAKTPKYHYTDPDDSSIGTEADPSQAPLMEHLKANIVITRRQDYCATCSC